MTGRVEAHISQAALAGNIERLAATAAPAATMLVVKSDAYGHDLMPCVRTGLDAGATWLGALEIPAALRLRAAGVTVPVFAWMHGQDADFAAAVAAGIDLGVSSAWQLEAIADSGSPGSTGRVHLKIDTGLRRSGANHEDWDALVTRALELERAGRLRVVAAWSHLSDTSAEEDHRSLKRFDTAVAEACALGAEFELLHVAASSAGIDYPEARHSLVRFGIAAFGISPFHDRSGRDLGLTPVMTLAAPVLASDARGATVAAGFGDGVQCLEGAAMEVLAGDRRVHVLEVDVDSMRIDAPNLPVGSEVLLFGPGDAGEPTAEEWAHWCDTVGDELVTGVTPRVPRLHT